MIAKDGGSPSQSGAAASAPLISLIIPVYNVKAYLRECLDSALAQTWPNLEILIVDDGSTDGSGNICDEYARRDARIRVFHTENGGLSCARNFALDRAGGEFLAFLDSDDVIEPNAIETLARAALRFDAGIAVCRIRNFCLNRQFDLGPDVTCPTVLEGDELTEQIASMDRIRYCVWNKLYRADLFAGIRFPAGRIYEDVSTVYRVVRRARRVVLLPDVLVDYRRRRSSLSNERSAKNLGDKWFAHFSKYNDLSGSGFPVADHPVLLAVCLSAAEQLWCAYAGLRKNEKAELAGALDEIRAFARAHLGEALRNRRIPVKIRLLSPALLLRRDAVFRLLHRLAARGNWFGGRDPEPGDVFFP